MISSPAAIASLELLFVARVEKNHRVQIAVARVKNIADLEAVFLPISLMRRSVAGSLVRGITPSCT